MSDGIGLLEEYSNKEQLVGTLRQDIIDLLELELPPGDILMNPGAIKHIKKRHINIFNLYFQSIPDIISNPDYVGINPTEPNSVELVKVFSDNILVAVKLDPSGNLCFSSIYDIKPGKLRNRLASGRLKEILP
ncbi:MAG: hypothetical protein MUO60_17725 [Clostridiaceae bacterium]|nr:hypothetical protein [Clostridiaceae bacterium]